MRASSPALPRSVTLAACLAALSAACAAGGAYKPAAPMATAPSAGSPAVGRPMPSAGTAAISQPSPGGSDTVSVTAPGPAPTQRPGLGTTWGESVYAPVTTQPFVRASSQPWAVAAIHYNDAEGVDAQARYLGGSLAPLELYPGDGSIGVSLVSESGQLLPGFTAGGQTMVVGRDGERYRIVVRNATDARFEIVASVDGLDVLDGKPADPARRGYILEPRGQLVIDGFRQTDDAVAAFRFGAVADSYAAQTSGDRNVGVIGVAIFAEEGARWTPAELSRRVTADPFPARSYATPP